MIIGNPDVSLTLSEQGSAELVLGIRADEEIRPLATADSGRLELYKGEFTNE